MELRPTPLHRFTLAMLLVVLFAWLAVPVKAQNSGPERDAWQHPELVLDALAVTTGSVVADVGCGRGYFTFKMAQRVGSSGTVYAEEVDGNDLNSIRREAARSGLVQIQTVKGTWDDPHLPDASLDAVLIMNAYHEFRSHDAMLQGIYRALKPGGRLGLIDGAAEVGHPRSYYEGMHRLPEAFEREDALRAGFKFLRQEQGFSRSNDGKQFYFLLFEKPSSGL
jgi:predicted methyltransferase